MLSMRPRVTSVQNIRWSLKKLRSEKVLVLCLKNSYKRLLSVRSAEGPNKFNFFGLSWRRFPYMKNSFGTKRALKIWKQKNIKEKKKQVVIPELVKLRWHETMFFAQTRKNDVFCVLPVQVVKRHDCPKALFNQFISFSICRHFSNVISKMLHGFQQRLSHLQFLQKDLCV